MIIREKVVEREIHKEQILLILAVFPSMFLLFAIILGISSGNIFNGIVNINLSPTILVTDFLELGGISAAFINSALIGFINIYLLKRFKMKINGLIIASFMTLIGFSFFGKNIINIIPLYLGGYLYAKHQKIHMRDVLVVIMFSTGLSPIISELMFAGVIVEPYNLIIGFVAGVVIGFVITPLASHMMRFHDGYNLYNVGFTAGIIGTVFTSILRSFDIEIEPISLLYQANDLHIKLLLLVLFIFLIIVGYIINNKCFIKYKKVLSYSGRTVTDFTYLTGYGVSFLNMGLMGIIALALVTIVGGVVNGPVLAAIFTIVGFSSFGKHPKNAFPVALGVVIAASFLGFDLSSTGIVISILFSTTIAPIAGAYGIMIGIISGMLHLALVTNIGVIHGGINLYNNGFSGGLVAGVVIPVVEAFKKGD